MMEEMIIKMVKFKLKHVKIEKESEREFPLFKTYNQLTQNYPWSL